MSNPGLSMRCTLWCISITSHAKVRDTGSIRPEAIETVYPHAIVQLCIVHMVRNSLNYVGWRINARKSLPIFTLDYSATAINEAERTLSTFEDKWNMLTCSLEQQ